MRSQSELNRIRKAARGLVPVKIRIRWAHDPEVVTSETVAYLSPANAAHNDGRSIQVGWGDEDESNGKAS